LVKYPRKDNTHIIVKEKLIKVYKVVRYEYGGGGKKKEEILIVRQSIREARSGRY
jgi:hypothetical protein